MNQPEQQTNQVTVLSRDKVANDCLALSASYSNLFGLMEQAQQQIKNLTDTVGLRDIRIKELEKEVSELKVKYEVKNG